MADEKRNYRDEIADEIIRRIETGTAPWQKPWNAEALGAAPFNPVSGKPYRGINDVWLSMMGHADPRWMTYRQALEADAQVRKGEKSTTIEYWQWTAREPLIDAAGKPVLDAEGKQQTQDVRLERPRVFYAKVFNAEQIDGLAQWVPPAPAFDPVARAEALITGAGVPVFHDQGNRAFYSPTSDEIHLPPMAAFKGQAAYYETALHELGHATGHQSRLGRDFGPFGSEKYAREELRAEMASYMLARDLGVSFDPGNHASYVESWLKVLREDKNEIFRAARDAETIKTWVMEPERRPELERGARQHAAAAMRSTIEEREEAARPGKEDAMAVSQQPRNFLAVPFAEKNAAKSLGAKWDRGAKSWYVPEGQDTAPFAKWAAPGKAPAAALSPVDEFAEALKTHGLVVEGSPVMDGKWHRTPVIGDRKGQLSGSYRGFTDGRPSGQITNYKAGGPVKWVAAGVVLTDQDRARVQAEAATIRTEREAARTEAAERAAKAAYGVWQNLPGNASPATCPYLASKGVRAHGVKVDAEGHLVVPGRDADGRLKTLQFVGDNGKRYLKDSQKAGCMHVVEGTGRGTLDALPDNDGKVIIAEGYATAATLFEATGVPTIAVFDGGNLKAVAEAVRAKYPDRPIVIAADNDHANVHGNVGWTKALEAANAVGGVAISPQFTPEEKAKGLTDFNDLAASRGRVAVFAAVKATMKRDHEPERCIA